MLLKSQISKILIHSDEWFAARLAKFTSSEFHFLMAPEGIGVGGMSYIYRKVGEELTGKPCRKEISTDATEHGHEYEPENLLKFGQKMGIEFLVTQTLILEPTGRFGSTPDGIWILNPAAYAKIESDTVNVSTVEAKCPTAYDAFIRLWNCRTPEDVKKVNKIYYYQVLHQMRTAGALEGYLSIYNPFFRAGSLNIVKFKMIDLLSEFKLMEKRSIEAVALFNDQRDRMISSELN